VSACRFPNACAALAVGALLACAVLPEPAAAHARLLRTSPAQAAELTRSPTQVALLFDETVRSTGRAGLSGGVLQRTVLQPARLERGGRLLVVSLPRGLRRGVYTVRWEVVSDDGHREVGALTFGVGEKPVGVPASAAEQTQADALLTLARWLFVLGVLAAAGLAGVRLALRPVLAEWPPVRAARPLAGALLLASLGAAIELAALPAALDTRFGVVTAVAGCVALAGAVTASRSLVPRRGLGLTSGLALGLVAAPALAGHALSPGRPRAAVLPIDLVHTAAAAAWLGGVLWLGLLTAAAVRPGGARVPLAVAGRLVSRLAMGAVGVLGATGIARAALELQRWGQLVSTGYGRLLLAKTAVFLALIGLGWWSGSRLLQRLRRGVGDGSAVVSLRRTITAEAVLLAAVAGIVAGLGSTAPPRSRAAAPVPPVRTVFGRQADELAVGIAATRVAGEVAVDATVLGRDGAGAGGLRVDVAQDAPRPSWSHARLCGHGRYCARVRTSAQAPRLLVRVRRRSGRASIVSATLPARPQPARAAALVAADERAIRGLHSLAITERLASDSTHVLRTTWQMVAPDRLSYTGRAAGEAIVIGNRRWDRANRAARWRRSVQDPRLRLPALDWSSAEDPSLLGPGTFRGTPVWLVSFRDPTVPAWFEVAIDRRTLRPLVVRMVAAGHFMARRYERFDERLRIEPPAAAR
jgi:copper transport protein